MRAAIWPSIWPDIRASINTAISTGANRPDSTGIAVACCVRHRILRIQASLAAMRAAIWPSIWPDIRTGISAVVQTGANRPGRTSPAVACRIRACTLRIQTGLAGLNPGQQALPRLQKLASLGMRPGYPDHVALMRKPHRSHGLRTVLHDLAVMVLLPPAQRPLRWPFR
ncbi:hypothetical protein SAMN05880593_12213 [Rhizobium sp. RU36D]|nr:hypothetical protein SAMN05880593_12213 [Rhizobium sp. RU36D]